MSYRPDAAGLLAIARDTLKERILPALPKEQVYEALMIANAMAIARRELKQGDQPDRDELARLLALYGEPSDAADAPIASVRAALQKYRRRLVDELRSGRFDDAGDRQQALLRHLRQTTRDRLRVNNPKIS